MITWHLYCKTLIGRGLTDALNPGFYCVFYSYSLGRQKFHLILKVLLPSEGTFAIRGHFASVPYKCTCIEITVFLPSDSGLKPFYSG